VASHRIISLLPSATEIVCALGAEESLVGISHECDFPEGIRDRPVLTRARIAVNGSSREIDTAVREVIRNALSIYEVDDAKLGALNPDVVVTQDLCEVCAVSLNDVRAAVARLAHRSEVQIVSLRPTILSDVLEDIVRVGRALGIDGEPVRAKLQRRIDAIAFRAHGLPRVRVVSLEWIDPLMIGGTWMPELIELAGGIAVGAAKGQPAPTIDVARLKDLNPEVVMIKPCGFTLERALQEREIIERSVLGPGRIYVTDGNAYFNRPGPRLVESLEILAACIHPDRFADLAEKHASSIIRLR